MSRRHPCALINGTLRQHKKELMSWKSLALVLTLLAIVAASPARAASCLAGGCHQDIAGRKYLHGPIAAEQMSGNGCAVCHVPAGKPCAPGKAGIFRPLEDPVRMCQRCHSRGTGTQHTSKKINCLKCHAPHGSDTSPDLQRP
ncbi:MAG: hypothetical protein C4563_00145 [Desulfobulbus sp.]|nr:MAG: hypothetical protein C4563_00145 [Desulfobulbus sp.]